MTTPNDPIDPTSHSVDATPVSDLPAAAFTPQPDRRPDWAAPTWVARAETLEPEPGPSPAVPSGFEPTGDPATPSGGGRATSDRRATGLGTVVLTALLAALLASGGTFLVLKGSGSLQSVDRGVDGQPAMTAGSNLPVSIDESSAVIDAAAKAGPTVVRILVEGTTTDVFGGTIPEQGVGSGIIFDSNGWVLTNRHVVTNSDGTTASKLTVEVKDGHRFQGTVYGIDTLTDLAIVKVDTTKLPAATIGRSADLQVGQLAVAIGSPLGTYSNSVTSGIVSATGRSITLQNGTRLRNLIQTDAAINPGNSGGPLLDATGDVIGINTAMATGSNGIGFAIPIDVARPIMQQALAGQKLSRPYIGIRYQTIDPQLQASAGLSVDHGALVSKSQDATGASLDAIVAGGPAAKAGVKEGDIILGVGSQTVDTEHPLDLVLSSFAPGQTVDLKILRAGQTITLPITLGTRPEGL
jgi:serine protease Do